MPAWRPDLKDADLEQAVLNDAVYRAERERILGFVQRLQTARSWTEFFELQRDLTVQARARQELLRDLRSQRTKCRDRIRELAREGPRSRADLQSHQRLLAT